MNDKKRGQISPDSFFGGVLTALAKKSETIVEIGCSYGEGSTKCLAAGLVRPTQHFWGIDCSPEKTAAARRANMGGRITFLCGVVLKPEECDITGKGVCGQTRNRMIPTDEPRLSAALKDMRDCSNMPYIGDQLPEQIDLLLLDGGEYTTRFEFLKLYKRCKVIALDDIRKDIAWKNYANHQSLMSALNPIGWELICHQPYERNGWSVFRRTDKRQQGHLVPAWNTIDDVSFED